ncbi:hypothetical protein E3N88_07665 [Mikania micrantha]|uniref:BHLH domain-containing protein n=1 Tax=Mikania micrantha TaxID=192012 RepID=A0A5N6PDZ0_9ASTR|nr:hypothetical protein E3N88_07665 [Mikania micrantha]
MMSFLDYQKSMFLIDNNNNGRVPGFAFMHNLAYMEHTGLELLELASSSSQLQFYQTAIFMGCKNGEIELGISNRSSQVNYEFELKKLLPGDFPQEMLPQPLDHQAPALSSSSSLRSLSMENNLDYPPFLFNSLQTSSIPKTSGFKESLLRQSMSNQTPSSSIMISEDPLQEALIQIRTNQLIPSREHEEAAMTRAILAVISSSSSPPSLTSSHQLQTPQTATSAFKRYQTHLGPIKRVQNRRNLVRRLVLFFRNLNKARSQQDYQMVFANRPASNQLHHHMISERKRREKLNESFQELRSLLPPGSKKDKASVLSNIKEYIVSLQSQVEELKTRNKILEAERSRKQILNQDFGDEMRIIVRITDFEDSTSDSREVNIEVNVRGNSKLMDLMVKMLEFMNQDENLSVMSIDAGTRMSNTEAYITNVVVLRLRIQGSEEWNKSSFQEALTRVLDDSLQS